ncbi:MAG TPA: hypothetical protein V6D12_21710 [Candidatus Obscuribacterales bacterium]
MLGVKLIFAHFNCAWYLQPSIAGVFAGAANIGSARLALGDSRDSSEEPSLRFTFGKNTMP